MISGYQRKKVVKKRVIASLSLLIDPAEVETLSNSGLVHPFVPMKEKLFQGVWKCNCSLKIMSHSKSPR